MRYSAVLLAGGKSSRMRRDKSLLEFEGQPLWRRQLETLRKLSPAQLMLAGPHRPGCEDCEIVLDAIPESGPLGAVAAALRQCSTPRLVVLAVDLPHITADFLRSLLAHCTPRLGVIPRMIAPQNFGAYAPKFCNRWGPLAAVYPAGCAALAANALRGGEFSMRAFVQRALERGYLHLHKISPREAKLFANLNTPADYEKYRARPIHPGR